MSLQNPELKTQNPVVSVAPTSKYTFGIALLVLAMGFLTYLVIELVGWRRGRSIVDSTQRLVRLSGAVALLLALGMMFFGMFFLQLDKKRPMPYIFYWAMVGALVIVALCLAFMDMRRLVQYQRESEQKMLKDFADIIKEHAQRERRTEGDSDNHKDG
jgi:magnesium-transporting ATPase (P-type)